MGARPLNTLWESVKVIKRLWLSTPVWDDLRFPSTAINPPGTVNDPIVNTTEAGLTFEDGKDQVLNIVAQLSHGYQEGTDIYPHIHWIQEQSGTPYFEMEYKWINDNDVPAASTTNIFTNENFFTYTSGSLAQMIYFPAIDGTGKKISSML